MQTVLRSAIAALAIFALADHAYAQVQFPGQSTPRIVDETTDTYLDPGDGHIIRQIFINHFGAPNGNPPSTGYYLYFDYQIYKKAANGSWVAKGSQVSGYGWYNNASAANPNVSGWEIDQDACRQNWGSGTYMITVQLFYYNPNLTPPVAIYFTEDNVTFYYAY